MRARVGAVGVVVLLFTAFVAAQTGRITGVVRDAAGRALPGVLVEVSSPLLIEKVRSTTTDGNGRYQISALPVGTYDVKMSLSGFSTHIQQKVGITSDFTATVDVTLKVGGVEQTVTVTAEPPVVDVVNARQQQTVFRGEDVANLPTARDIQGVILVDGMVVNAGKPGTGFGNHGATQALVLDTAKAQELSYTLSGSLGESETGGAVINGVPGGIVNGGLPPPGYSGVVPGATFVPNNEAYAAIVENPFQRVADEPLSTFSIDVDTASYANIRRFLNAGALPPANAVRIEEMINYFRFEYPQPKTDVPFSITTEHVESPWNPKHRLVLVGLQGREMAEADVPPRNLVFLLDVSGSMQPPERLPLIRNGMRMLVDTLRPRDRVAIVVYAGHSGLVLPSTTGDQKATIHEAIARLEAGGSTNGAAGITLAYQVAREQFVKGGVNRVILATDGDFNVGVTSHDELTRLIERERESGIFLSVLGVGTGNLKDSRMEMLADKGNGNYAYLDSLQEARRVLVREANGTLVTIAKDVKIQVEFNPQTVAAYRLIGYENRLLKKEDFNDDRKDAGEIGSGHSVTALYEVVPVGVDIPNPPLDPLKYQQPPAPAPRAAAPAAFADELMTVKLRYKAPDGDTSRLVIAVVRSKPQPMSANIGFASAVAELGMLLRGSQTRGSASFEALAARAGKFRGGDADGYRAEFIKLAELASSLKTLQGASLQSSR
jgi:Ca-activated chloride channel family protein